MSDARREQQGADIHRISRPRMMLTNARRGETMRDVVHRSASSLGYALARKFAKHGPLSHISSSQHKQSGYGRHQPIARRNH